MLRRIYTGTNLFVLIFALGCLFLAPHSVSAHATPVSYDPEATSLVSTAPKIVRIHFSERIEPGASVMTIFGPDGGSADLGSPSVDPADPSVYRIGLKDSGQGTYTVSWAVVSADDGHFTKGAFSFSVGKETVSQGASGSQIQIQHLTSVPEAVTIGIELLGQAIIIGALTFFLLIWPLWKKGVADIASYSVFGERRFAALIFFGIFLIFAGGISFLILKTFDLEQLQSTGFFETLKTFVHTANGTYTLYRLGLALAFGIGFILFRKRLMETGLRSSGAVLLYVLLALIIFARTKVSHAAATHFHPDFAILIHSIHLFFKELWVGAPIVFLLIFLPLVFKVKNSSLLSSALTTLSKVLSIGFAIVGITGAYIVWLDLKNPANLATTEWGSRFLLLFTLSGIWLGVRLYHQFIADRAAASDTETGFRRKSVFWLPYSFMLEFLIGITVLFVTSYLIITTPPYASDEFGFKSQIASQGERISLEVHPYESKEFLVTVTDKDNVPETSLTNLIVTLKNEEKNIGPLTASVEERFPGGYVFPANLLSPVGLWRITVTAQRPNAYDAVTSFSLNYPADIETTRLNPDLRTFGAFEAFLLVTCILIIAFSALIWLYSRRVGLRTNSNRSQIEGGFVHPFAGLPITVLLWGVTIAIIWFATNTFAISDFQKLCEANGNFWLQSVPMRNGVALSSDTVTGCTLNVGLNHFTDIREYKYFLRTATTASALIMHPPKPVAGKPVSFTISLTNVQNGRDAGPATDLAIEHERIMHVIIMGSDLKTFAHIHPEDFEQITPEVRAQAKFDLEYTFPKAGRYTIAVNYYVRAQQFVQQFFVDVTGDPSMDAPVEDLSRTKTFDGYDVALDAPQKIKAGEQTTLTYTVQKGGTPVTDLEPYLGAAMHLGIVDFNLQGFMHGHGGPYLPGSAALQTIFQNYVNYHNHFVPDKFGPKIQARITFPHAGIYQIFGEMKHHGQHIVTSFMVKVD